LALGMGLDALLGDPRRAHPVAAFGTLAGRVEQLLHRDARGAGVVYAAALTGGAALLGAAAARTARGPGSAAAVTALATWAVLGGTTLRREARAMSALLEDDDLAGARARLPHLCGRDPSQLRAEGLARATVESVAENTSDAVVGPLMWGALLGVPGLLGYRAVNTLDAMVGHRSPRYARFGWAAARADDVANLLPARLTAALAVALAPVVGGRSRAALHVWRRDGGKHPSPNAGPVEAAFAGALGRTLGGRLSYAGRVEDRPLLGDGPAPDVADVGRATRLSAAVAGCAGALAVGTRLLLDRARR
ncbi:MAG TPA: cobalamin biosynthesis protein, partial [Mycobacteriales bacterium]|nr:cobalamin biosynthesis protein [Mycobacteriales bacterium]